jgi:TonB family protein
MKALLLLLFLSTRLYSQTDPTDEKPMEFAEKMPGYPGGLDKMLDFINENIQYPKGIKKADKGVNCVYVSFIVEKDGSMSGIKVLRGAQGGEKFDREAVRVVGLMPNWTPGMYHGRVVRVVMNVPVKFVAR